METLVPFLMMMLIGTLAVVLYLGRRREEVAREQALNRRIRTFVPLLPRAGAANRRRCGRGRAVVLSGDHHIGSAALCRSMAGAGRNDRSRRENFWPWCYRWEPASPPLAVLWFPGWSPSFVVWESRRCPWPMCGCERKRRLATFSQQLPYMLDFLRSALSAGHTLLRGVQMATENSPEPIATELRLVVDQIQLGSSSARRAG